MGRVLIQSSESDGRLHTPIRASRPNIVYLRSFEWYYAHMARRLKVASGQFLLRPLNVIFGAPSHVALLRALTQAGRGLTGREVARAAGVAQRAGLDGLTRLENAGIVRRTPAGSANVYELRREHRLVQSGIVPLLEQEGELRAEIFARLHDALDKRVVSGCIFGSTARGDDTPESDLDILLLVERPEDKERAEDGVSEVFEGLRQQFSLRPSLVVLTRAEFARGYRAGRAFMRNVMREGETFAGRPLKALVDA
jgi:predicted nucleotidyltransferase